MSQEGAWAGSVAQAADFVRVPHPSEKECTVPTSLLAYHDPKFMDSDEGRPVRIVSEYLAPLRALSAAGVSATVVFFGSARVQAGTPLARYLDDATELARLVTAWSRSRCGER